MPLELLVLDCDGTILRSVDIKTRAFSYIGSLYSPEAEERMVAWHKAQGGVSRYTKFAQLFREMFGREITPQETCDLGEKFQAFCIDALRKAPLMPGVLSVLQRWHKRVPIYVASGAPQEELEELLESNNLNGFFAGIYGSPPAKTALLRLILKESGAASAYTVMVGDGQVDLAAAEALETMFYGVGEAFKGTRYPWHEDLTLLNDWLEQLVAEN